MAALTAGAGFLARALLVQLIQRRIPRRGDARTGGARMIIDLLTTLLVVGLAAVLVIGLLAPH